jgi:hypothetical protein
MPGGSPFWLHGWGRPGASKRPVSPRTVVIGRARRQPGALDRHLSGGTPPSVDQEFGTFITVPLTVLPVP